jgi:hypothetical protein
VAKLRVLFLVLLYFYVNLSSSRLAYGQEGSSSVFLSKQEVRVANLPSLTAPSPHRSAVFATALETVLHDKAVCCGKDSALEDVALYATLSAPFSLRELSTRLQGRHLLSDGQPILVNAEYLSHDSISPALIINTLTEQHAQLIQWKSQVYVLYGALFDETRDSQSGVRAYAIRKLFLLDLRFSDQRREAVFDRETDDWGQMEGLLMVGFAIPPSPWK